MKLMNKCSLFFAMFALLIIGSPGVVKGDIEISEAEFQAAMDDAAGPKQCAVDTIVESNKLNGKVLFQKDLYTHSNIVVSRSIHDLPLFMQTNAGYREDYCFGAEVDPFYNQTTKMFFADSSPNIKSYADFSNEGVIGTIINRASALFPNINISASEVLPLFSSMTLQEHRAGLYIRLSAYVHDWTVQFAVPVVYQERNFFFNEDEQQKLKQIFSRWTTGMGDDDAQTMMMKHIVSDKIGLGDMRFHLLYTPYESCDTRCTLGGFVTVPTAFPFKNGLMGGSFYKNNYIPPFSLLEPLKLLCETSTTVSTDEVMKSLQAYGLAALHRLTEILAETPLGNGGHVGIAPIIECSHVFGRCDNVEMGILGQASFQGFLPCSEKRAYLVQNIDSEFTSRDYDPIPHSEDIAQGNIDFFNRQLNNLLFPTIIDTKVTPGLIFETNAAFTYKYADTVKGQLGYDFWYRGNESVAMSNQINGTYDILASKTAKAWQQKLFASLETWFPFCGGDLTTRFGGDVTVASKGIGKDFTINVLLQLSY